MKIITHNQIMSLNIQPKDCYEWINESFTLQKKCVLPTKTSMIQPGHVFYNIMPSLNPIQKVGGLKVVTRYPGRMPSLDGQVFLYSMDDAKLKAIIDANYITAMRTGAVAALAIEKYAIKKTRTIALMGLGVTATAIMEMLAYTLKDKNIVFKLYKYKEHAEKMVERYNSSTNFTFEICDSYEELIRGSDVVVSSVTYTDEYFAKFEWFKEGVLLLPVHVMGFGNCDYLFDQVFVDDVDHLRHLESFNKFKEINEMCDVITQKHMGRKNDKERIVAYNIGVSIHDIIFANKIYEMLADKNCIEIDLEAPMDKYWL